MEDFLPYLPPLIKCPSSFSLSWPSEAENLLREIRDGECVFESVMELVDFICLLRRALSFSPAPISRHAASGIQYFFCQIMSRREYSKWRDEVFPKLANLLLKLPSLLEEHYRNATNMDIHGEGVMVTTVLRILESQQKGVVCLSQELIAGLLACSLFCLFPDENRPAKHLPVINLDQLFGTVDFRGTNRRKLRSRIWCILIYFERITFFDKCIVSFERRVLYRNDSSHLSYPDAIFWRNSANSLCEFKADTSRLIDYQSGEAVEVYFAGNILGGDTLVQGTSEEEIRFMLSPELIAGMLFLPAIRDNEAIEIVGAERFSTYAGFESEFRFSDVYVDKTGIDALGRRKSRIVAVDKLCIPRNSEYAEDIYLCRSDRKGIRHKKLLHCFLHEVFINRHYNLHATHPNIVGTSVQLMMVMMVVKGVQEDYIKEILNYACLRRSEINKAFCGFTYPCKYPCGSMGVATADRECDPNDTAVRAIIMWLAASQARRPFITYCTSGREVSKHLGEVASWISSSGWTVGHLWNKLIEYTSNTSMTPVSSGGSSCCEVGFFQWLQFSMERVS
ncbi:hypothetical protein OROHE_003174 [Orobanche hederae]